MTSKGLLKNLGICRLVNGDKCATAIVSFWEKPNLISLSPKCPCTYFLIGTLCSLNFPALSIRVPIKLRHGKSTIYNPFYRFYVLIVILFTFTQRSTALLKTPCVRHVTHNLESFEEKQPVFGGSKGQGAASKGQIGVRGLLRYQPWRRASPGNCLGKQNLHIFKELMGFETRDSHQQVCMDILTAAVGMCGTNESVKISFFIE